MRNKRNLLFTILVLLTGTANSAVTDGFNLGSIGGGILGLMSSLIGIRVDDPTTAIGIAAILGTMTILVYLPIKLAAKRLDIEESVLGTEGSRTSSGKRNIGIILAVLITLSTIPTGFFELLITGYGVLSVLIGFLMLVMVGYAAISFFGSGASGLSSLSKSVGSGLEADAKKAKAGNLEAEAKALEKEQEARERWNSAYDNLEEIEGEVEGAEAEARDGGQSGSGEEEEEAVERIRNSLNALAETSENFPDELEKDKKELDDAIKRAKKELSLDNSVDEGIIDLHKRFERIRIYLVESETILGNQLSNGNPLWDDLVLGNGDYQDISSDMDSELFDFSKNLNENAVKDTVSFTTNYGLYEVLVDLERAQEEIELVENELYPDADNPVDPNKTENKDLTQEFMDLLEATEDATDFSKVLKEMKEVLKEVHSTDEEIEEISSEYNWKQIYDKADENEDMIDQVMNRIKHLSDVEQELNEKIKEAHELLEKQVYGTEDILEELKKLTDYAAIVGSNDNQLRKEALKLQNAVNSNNVNLTEDGSGNRYIYTGGSPWIESNDSFGFTKDSSGNSICYLTTASGDGLVDTIVNEAAKLSDPLAKITHEEKQREHEERDVLEDIEEHLNSS